jgi:hypothetical protein
MNEATQAALEQVERVKYTRDELRARILGQKVRRVPVELNDADGTVYFVDVQEPVVDRQLDQPMEQTNKERMIKLVIDHTFVPDTNERVFEDADLDGMQGMPFGQGFGTILNKIMELTNLVEATKQAGKSSEKVPTSS